MGFPVKYGIDVLHQVEHLLADGGNETSSRTDVGIESAFSSY